VVGPSRAPGAASLFERLNRLRRETHYGVLTLVNDLTDDQLRLRPGPHAPDIGFHVWHLARRADHDRALIEGTPQIWAQRELASVWGLAPVELGQADAGTEMGDEASEALLLPAKDLLLEYARETFDALDATLTSAPPDSLNLPFGTAKNAKPLVDYLFVFVTHDNRHLGMIEALRGVLGLRGTASN
jgi:hypothetical protein